MILGISLRRWVYLFFGLALFGVGIALMKRSNLGLGPWAVLSDGISTQTGLPLGTIDILTGIVIFLLWIPLGERPGVGSVANLILIGLITNATLALVSPAGEWLPQLALMLAGIFAIAAGSGFYLGARLGAGPRDGLMMGLLRKTRGSVRVIRTCIEIVVLVIGWSLGGAVGIGTVVFAVTIGPLVQVAFRALNFHPHAGAHADAVPARSEPASS